MNVDVNPAIDRTLLIQALTKYSKANDRIAIWQLVNTMIPYAALVTLMIIMVRNNVPYWITLLLSIIAALFLIRIFIFFHDACHGSFFSSRTANTITGYITGILTFTPYFHWRHSHAVHHSTAGNLDKRGTGDVWTMTVQEYKEADKFHRFLYRFIRHPLVMFGLGPAVMFLIVHRFAGKDENKREKQSVLITNLALLAILLVAYFTIGLGPYFMVQLPIIYFAGMIGLWMFYVQHQYATVYWAHDSEWDRIRAAFEGASFYKLPKVLQWFSGSIGYHHIHHLRAGIPNYNLERCYRAVPMVQKVTPITIRSSLNSLWMNLIDESAGRMVSFKVAMKS